MLYINSKCDYNLSLNKHQKVCEKAQATLIDAIDDLAKARQFFPKKSGPGNGIFPTKKNDFDGVTMEVLRQKREKLANPEMRNLSDVDLEKLLKTLKSQTEGMRIYRKLFKSTRKMGSSQNAFVGLPQCLEMIQAGVDPNEILWQEFVEAKEVSLYLTLLRDVMKLTIILYF